MEEETKQNPYIGEGLKSALQQYDPSDMKQFESQYTVKSKNKQTIVAETNKEIQRLLLTYLEHVGEKRSQDSQSSNIGAAEAFISFIKYTCIDIIRAKCVIRQSLQYMYEIMESKPVDSALDEKGKKLWDNLKKTLEKLNSANEKMLEVSHRYFGFLLKFWEALSEFCRQQTKLKPPSMEISINALNKHLFDFIQFKQNYDRAIARVDEAAQSGMKLFDEVIGGQAIADAFKTRQDTQNKLDELRNKYKKTELDKIDLVQGLNKQKAENAGKIAMNGEEIKYFKGVYKTMEEWEQKEKEAYQRAQDKVRDAEDIKKEFDGHRMNYVKKKTEIDAKARGLKLETAEAAKRDKKYLEQRGKQIDQDLRNDKNEANKLNNQAQSLLNKASSTRDKAVSTLNDAKYKSDYETVHHYSYSYRRSWWGWSRYSSWSHWTSQRHTGTATRYRNVAKDLNRMADDIQNSALKLNDKADAMKNNAIKRAELEREYQQKQYELSIINNQKMLDLAKQIEESAKVEMENAKLMENEADKQEDRVKQQEAAAAKKEAQLKAYQELKQEQEKRNVESIGKLDTKNKELTAENLSLDEKIKEAENRWEKDKVIQEKEIKEQEGKLEQINKEIVDITKQIGVKGKEQLIDFANMTMEIFPNLQNVKDGAAALKVGFEDFALVLSLRINSQITIGWYFQITRIFDDVACKVIANALNKRAFYKMNDLNYYDEYGQNGKKAKKKFKQKIAPIITKCLRIKGDGNNNMDNREGINDNDDEKSITKSTNTTEQTLNPTPNYIEVEDQDVVDNYVDKLRNLFVKEKNIYGEEEQGIKGWIQLSKEQKKVNREWIIEISPALCYFFNNMSNALKFSMNQIVMESYRQNESRINSISAEIKRLLQKQASLTLPTFVFEKKQDPWLRYLKQWKLDKYKEKFIELGYDDSSIWKDISEEDMKNDLGFKKGDILKFKSRRKEIKKGGDNDESDDDGSKKKKKTKRKKSKKGRKTKKYESSSDDESSDDESSSDESSSDESSSDDDDTRKSKKKSRKSRKSKKGKKKKKRRKRDESSDDDEDESSDTDDDGESSSDDSRDKKRKKKQNKKKDKKKKDKKKLKKKKNKKKKKDISSDEETNTESDDDSKDETDSDNSSSSENESNKIRKKKNKKKNKSKIKKQNKKKTKKKSKKKKRKQSTDESESNGSGSSGSSSSSEGEEEKPKKKESKGRKDKKKRKGKKGKKGKSKKKVSDDESDESSSD